MLLPVLTYLLYDGARDGCAIRLQAMHALAYI